MSDLNDLMNLEALDLGKKENVVALIAHYRKMRSNAQMGIRAKKTKAEAPDLKAIMELIGGTGDKPKAPAKPSSGIRRI